jgi:hypothetical protein
MIFRNPQYNSSGSIDCEIDHPDYEWIPFTCEPNDTGAQFDTSALFKEMKSLAKPYKVPKPHEKPEQSESELSLVIRYQRDQLLRESDWTQLPDVPKSIKSTWSSYRQKLRDIPQQSGFPFKVEWPEKPS